MFRNIQDIISGIRRSIDERDESGLEDVVGDYAIFCFKEDNEGREFNAQIFDLAMELMEQPQFLSWDGSHTLLMVFEFDWATMTVEQRGRLLDAIENSYSKYFDWMSCFVLSQLLGEYYSDDSSFRVLCKLLRSSGDIPRSLLAMGFEKLARFTDSVTVKKESLEQLHKLKTDLSEQVQTEARDSLARLLKRGIT